MENDHPPPGRPRPTRMNQLPNFLSHHSSLVNQQQANFPMPVNEPNGGFSFPKNHLRRQENYPQPPPNRANSFFLDPYEILGADFNRLNLSTSANHSSLPPMYSSLTPSTNGRYTNSVFDDSSFVQSPLRGRGQMGLYGEDLRGQMGLYGEDLRGQMGLYGEDLRGHMGLYGSEDLDWFAISNSNYFTDIDEFDNMYHGRKNLVNSNRFDNMYHASRNLVNSNRIMHPFRSPNELMLENPSRHYRNDYMSNLGSANRNTLDPELVPLEEMRGKVLSLAMDQNGCRFLQKKFEERKPEDIDLIFSEVKDYIRQLMVHQFGNYLIQKFFDVCDQQKISQILASVISDEQAFLIICLDIHGTRAMQKLLEKLTTREQRTSIASVLGRVGVTVKLTKSAHGHHVIQYCLKSFHCEEITPILRAVADHCVRIATDKSGCCVLQKCIEFASPEYQDRLVAEITENALYLSYDPYGNYVVQFAVDLANPHYTAGILGALSGNFVPLSMDKYGSNVVEKCIMVCKEEDAARVIQEIIYSPNFVMVIQNAYGNYVAQSAWLYSKGDLHVKISGMIQRLYPELHSHPHGKRALARAKGSRKPVCRHV